MTHNPTRKQAARLNGSFKFREPGKPAQVKQAIRSYRAGRERDYIRASFADAVAHG